MAEQLRISYQVPEGHGKKVLRSVTVDRPDHLFKSSVSKKDSDVITQEILKIAPGTNFNQHKELHRQILVERVYTTSTGEHTDSLTGWNRKVKRRYNRAVRQLNKDLGSVKARSKREGKQSEKEDYNARPHKRFLFLGWEASPVAVAIAGRVKTGPNHLRPGQRVEDMASELKGVIRRAQDVDAGDPENLTHGIGAILTDRIKEIQSGIGSGFLANVAEDRVPGLKAAMEIITTTEKFSSTDPKRTKAGYFLYEAFYNKITGRSKHKHKDGKKKGVISRLWKHSGAHLGDALVVSPVVVEQKTDRQSGRVDRSELMYVNHILNGEVANPSSIAFKRYQMDMAIAYQSVLEHVPGKVVSMLRRGEAGLTGQLMEKVKEEVEGKFPGVMETLNQIMEHHEATKLPEGYKEKLAKLKQLADSGSPLEYFTYLQEMSQDEATISQLAPEKQTAWKLSNAFSRDLLGMYTKAKELTDASRNVQTHRRQAAAA